MRDFETGVPEEDVRVQLRRILHSDAFDASSRNRLFLAYVVEETLEGRAGRIKAYAIATAVFGRSDDFDPQLDSIVRIEAGRLRRSIERYYLTAGEKDPVRITIPIGSYAARFDPNEPRAADAFLPPSDSSPAHSRPHRGPAVFVAPFEEEGDQSAFPNLTHGFTRQIIVALTRFTELFVFGPETSFRPGRPADRTTPPPDLDVDFVLTGGTTISAERFGAEVMLVEARTGRYLWAESFDRILHAAEISRIRDEVANSVARSLAQPSGVIFANLARNPDETPPENMTSYDMVLQSYHYKRRFDRRLFDPIRLGLEKVIEQDPYYAEAFACLSEMYSSAHRFDYAVSGEVGDPLQRSLALARRAIELSPNSSRGYFALSIGYWFSGDVKGALEALESSRALNPNDTEVLAELGLRYAFLADWEKAAPLLEESFARNPAQSSVYRIGLALLDYAKGDFMAAFVEAGRIDAPDTIYPYLIQAAAAGRLGQRLGAEAALKGVGVIDPDYLSRAGLDLARRNLHPDMVSAILNGLEEAEALVCPPPRALRS